ncbi:MAG: HAMP domain-containing histidine kinase [Lachnospiraceae bacterium]|nr:HAMP domain-containing histidine kinase [Lachnospiraceae bacterium]
MKIQTRMIITFVAVAFIPLILIVLIFLMVRMSISSPFADEYPANEGITGLGIDMEEIVVRTDRVYLELEEKVLHEPSMLEDKEYLNDVCNDLAGMSSTLVVRKGDELFFSGSSRMCEEIWDRLPPYGYIEPGDNSSLYFEDLEEYVRQLDFMFPDGTAGSIFIVVRVNSGINRKLKVDMLVAMILVMLITALLVTLWNKKGILDPMTELSKGLTQVREGNFDYVIEHNGVSGEVGDLLRNYEDMRMRLRENEERNAEQEKKNKELVSNITHDLKTPITSIKGYVEGILDGVAATPEKQEKYLKTIYNKAVDMDKLINELTLYSSVDNDRIKYNFLRINVSDYFRDCVEEVGLDMETRGIRFEYKNGVSADTLIIADPEQLRKVINNIVGNSVKYMDKQVKTISMRLLDGGEDVIVEIEDNGKGIAATDLSRVFERFYRADAARTTAQGGSGIGLSIVKKIIEDHGGHIWATSKEGEGTCMHFVIRKYKEDIHG